MHHVVLERWSRGDSWIHLRDARVKLVLAFAFLICAATTRSYLAFGLYGFMLVAGILVSKLPLAQILMRAAVVLPFSLVFGAMTLITGDVDRAAALVFRSYLSASAVLLLAGSTRLPDLLRALEWFRVPALLILVSQFLYRYLFVLSEQAQHMRLAAQCRRGAGRRGLRLHAAAGALSVLFARSYQRADGVHRAMLARGFTGHFPSIRHGRPVAADFVLLLLTVSALSSIRFAVDR